MTWLFGWHKTGLEQLQGNMLSMYLVACQMQTCYSWTRRIWGLPTGSDGQSSRLSDLMMHHTARCKSAAMQFRLTRADPEN